MTPRRFLLLPLLLCLLNLPASAQIPADVSLTPAFGGAGFTFPIAVRHAGDGSQRRFVVERAGRIRIVDSNDNVLPALFLDVSSIVNTTSEGGLLGLAFHPDYPANGRFFVHYTYDGNPGPSTQLISRIAEFEVSPSDANLADPGSERIILEIPQDFNNHNGGDLHFGPDGYLYIGMGDGGSGNDPCNRAQTLDPADLLDCGNHPTTAAKALLGKMLRIDIDSVTPPDQNQLCGAAEDGSAPYAIPADNPYLVGTFRDRFQSPGLTLGVTEGACAETWSYGLRNPFRFSFDRDTGDLWIGDVGQSTWEEISLEPAGDTGGRNYGWKICEGEYLRGSTTELCTLADHSAPVLTYAWSNEPCSSVTGGYRYRGPVTSMQGFYVYGDYCSGEIWFASESSPGSWSELLYDTLGGTFGNLVGFGEDEAGHLYVVRGSGEVLRFSGDED
jgi:glucose/arabinose dehydrogenase